MESGSGIFFLKRLSPLAGAQFLGIFNDHAFKTIAVLAAVGFTESYARDSAFLAMLSMAYVLPFLIFSEAAGYLADRFPKRNVLVISKFAEVCVMALGALTLFKINSWGIAPLVSVMFLMAAQSAFFSPSFNGIIPEIFNDKEISHANGNIGMANFFAVIIGVGAGFMLKTLVADNLYLCGFLFTGLGLTGFLFTLRIPQGRAGNPQRKWHWNVIIKYWDGVMSLLKKPRLFLAMLSESYFFAVGAAVQTVLIVFAKYTLGIPGERSTDIGIIQLALAGGMGLGCWLAGRLSAGRVELGLVPFGAAGMVMFFFTAALFPGEAISAGGIMFYPLFLGSLFLLGISGGLFVIPLRAYQQNFTNPEERGNFFANANMVCFFMIMISSAVMFMLTSGSGEAAQRDASIFENAALLLQSCCLSIDPRNIFMGMGVLTFIVSVLLFIKAPEYVGRCIILLISRTIYKIKMKDPEHIPEHGPALLVANHVSFVDGLLITACTSRLVHFLMHEDYYRQPLIYPFVKWAGIVEVPSAGKPRRTKELFETTRELLRKGELVCLFPEGKITRNGIMDEFRKGLFKMIPENMDVPIIPIRLGMLWGSIFSYYYGKIRFKLPIEFPHPASVTVGKPLDKGVTPFKIRQVISELAAETEMEPREEERPIHYRFCLMARRHPFHVSVKDADGKEFRNFELFVGAALLSREIRKMVPKDRKYVGVMLPSSTISVMTVLGTMLADKVPAMLNFSASRESIVLSAAKAKLNCILTSRKFLQKIKMEPLPEMVFLEDIAPKISKLKKIIYTSAFFLFPRQEIMNFLAPNTHRNVFGTAVLLFSSGSTGIPKGIMLSHHNINSDVYSCIRIMGWRNSDRIVGNLPLFHSFGITTCFWIPLMIKAKAVYVPNPLDGETIGRVIAENGLTVLLATPTFLQSYMRKCKPEQFKSLRLVVTGAEKLRRDIAEKFKQMTGLEVIEGYGSTELSPIVSINIANSILNLGKRPGKPGSVGPPMSGICVKIVNPETLEELEPGQEGLMLVKGPNVMQGYLDEPQKTHEVIKNGWYNTGDIGKMDLDGYLTVTGRLSRFSKIGGEMIPHELVEKAIFEILKSEDRCIAVMGAPDSSKGEKLVVVHSKIEMTPEEIIEELREKELTNLWIPKASNFIEVEALPLLGTGKLDLVATKKIVEDHAG
ncbi:MAG: hypothetical protein A2020_03020 [Lentisphaerae bacterium GWF2_45_14]|nr:MAG: hypothetical protein A2020_03020 [Lentisphaerae bacterium GWF2_45_14]